MCCLEDALSPTWAQRRRRACRRARRDAAHARVQLARGQDATRSASSSRRSSCARAAGISRSATCTSTAGPSRRACSTSRSSCAGTARESVARGSGPYVYLAKLESRHEAELWNDVFVAAQEAVGLPRGTIRATVLIETITASFEMEEILYALREHCRRPQRRALGLHLQRDQEVPRRPGVRAARPRRRDDGRAVHARLHRAARARLPPPRRARDRRHGGVHPEPRRGRSTSRPSRACARTRSARRARASTAPGSRIPGLVPLAREIFDAVLGDRPNQKARLREDVVPDARGAARARSHAGRDHARGRRRRTSRSACATSTAWLGGVGAAAIDNLMEDAATAEISRAQLWQWIRHALPRRARARSITPELYARERDAVLARLAGDGRVHLDDAARAARRARAGQRLRAVPHAARRRAAAVAGEPNRVMRIRRLPALRPPRVAPARVDRDARRRPCSTSLLPERALARAGVIFPIVAVLGVLPLTIADALGRAHPALRVLALTLLGFTAAANGASLALLVRELLATQRAHERAAAARRRAHGLARQRDRVRALVLGARPRRPAAPRAPTAATRPTSSSRR